MRAIGTQAKGIRTPIIRVNDNLVDIVVNSIEEACKQGNFEINDFDVVSVTEAVVARSQGNYATTDQIAKAVAKEVGSDTIGVVFPIMSRNRFANLLRGISKAGKKVIVQFSYPSDEVGNSLVTLDQIDEHGVNPYSDSFTEAEFRKVFGDETKHRFTGVDYIELYKSLGNNIEVVFSNDPKYILNFADNVIAADIHSCERTKRVIRNAGAKTVVGLDNIMNTSIEGSGYNPQYGLLGSNTSGEDSVKLFPRDCDEFVLGLQKAMRERFGKHVETMIYGDGAFKDSIGGIWELADPVVSPAFTEGLRGTPNEMKLKYVADNEFKDLHGEELTTALRDKIRQKDLESMGKVESLGTTPRQITDLIGSLSDLVSGSGDKGTPVVLIQGYFDNYATE